MSAKRAGRKAAATAKAALTEHSGAEGGSSPPPSSQPVGGSGASDESEGTIAQPPGGLGNGDNGVGDDEELAALVKQLQRAKQAKASKKRKALDDLSEKTIKGIDLQLSEVTKEIVSSIDTELSAQNREELTYDKEIKEWTKRMTALQQTQQRELTELSAEFVRIQRRRGNNDKRKAADLRIHKGVADSMKAVIVSVKEKLQSFQEQVTELETRSAEKFAIR